MKPTPDRPDCECVDTQTSVTDTQSLEGGLQYFIHEIHESRETAKAPLTDPLTENGLPCTDKQRQMSLLLTHLLGIESFLAHPAVITPRGVVGVQGSRLTPTI